MFKNSKNKFRNVKFLVKNLKLSSKKIGDYRIQNV